MSSPPPPCVLVVEDDPILRRLLATALCRSGFAAWEAATGEQALLTLRNPKLSIEWLLTDICLPGGIDGWVVANEFNFFRPRRPVVYVSGVEEDALGQRDSNSIFLRKPVNVRQLVNTFKDLSTEWRVPCRWA